MENHFCALFRSALSCKKNGGSANLMKELKCLFCDPKNSNNESLDAMAGFRK